MWRSMVILTLFVICPVRALTAQAAQTLRSGDHVRVQALSQKGVYEVVELNGTMLVVRDRRTREEIPLSMSDIERLDVRLGRRSSGQGLARGMGIGLLVGGIPGAAIGFASGDDPPGWFSFTAGEKAMLLGGVFGVAGTVVGGVIGAVTPGSRWQRVVPATRVGVVPLETDAFRVVLSRSF